MPVSVSVGSGGSGEEQALYKYFEAYDYEHNPAEGLDFRLEEVAETPSDIEAGVNEDKCYGSDDYQRSYKPCRQKEGKSYPDGEGVDTGGKSEHEGDFYAESLGGGFYLFHFECFDNHFGPDETEQPEGDPVIDMTNKIADRESGGPADKRHKGLEKCARQGKLKDMSASAVFVTGTRGY